MFYLIGVEHEVQHISDTGVETANHTEYRECLEQAIKRYRPVVAGEEYSQDSLIRANFGKLIPTEGYFTKQIADKHGVEHRLCDPRIPTRVQLGYRPVDEWHILLDRLRHNLSGNEIVLLSRALEIAKSIPIREQYWLDQLKDVLQKDVIFVCGDSHIESFGKFLSDKGISSTVVKRQIGMPPDLIRQSDAELAYAKNNLARVEHFYQKILDDNGGTLPDRYSLLGYPYPQP